MALFAFRRGIHKPQVETDILINFEGSEKKYHKVMSDNNIQTPLETSSVGTASDGGYGSGLISMEDLSRNHPSKLLGTCIFIKLSFVDFLLLL